MDGMGMAMTFTNSYRVTLWFDGWRSDSIGEYIAMLIGVTILAATLELLITFRHGLVIGHRPRWFKLEDTPLSPEASTGGDANGSPAVRILSTVLYGAIVALGYLLMLATMTYNVGLFLAVVFGLCIGKAAFGPAAKGNFQPEDFSHCAGGAA